MNRRQENPVGKRVETKGLRAFYGDFLAVSDVDLSIEACSVTALIGPSGTGKSTVLRALNRLHEVTPGGRIEGAVLLDGDNIYDPGVDPVQVRRTVGMVFQRPNPFPTMSIYGNVAAGVRLNHHFVPKPELDDIVEESLRSANLWTEVKNRLNRPGTGLSGGQQQRLSIARALAAKPDVLLMDEPASALDPISTLAIEDLVKSLKQQYTIVIVTHNMQQAARVSDTTAFFDLQEEGQPGRLVEAGPTTKIFSNPNHPRTEAYVSGHFG